MAQENDDRPVWIRFISRVWMGILVGMIAGGGMTQLIPVQALKPILILFLSMVLLMAGLSYLPIAGDLIRSARRALVPKKASARLETWFWHNALATLAVVFLFWIAAGMPAPP